MNKLLCGKIVNTHGVRGEVKIECYCDYDVFEKIKDLYVENTAYNVVARRMHKGFFLVALEGIEDVECAMALKGKEIYGDKGAIKLPKGHFFFSDIYGFEVYDHRTEQIIGTLKEVRENPANMLYVIDCAGVECMIPAIEPFSLGADFEQRRLNVKTIEGMLPNEN